MHWISIKEFKYYCIAVCFAFLGGINAHNISGFNFKRVIDFSVRNCRRNRIFRWHCAAKAYRLLAQVGREAMIKKAILNIQNQIYLQSYVRYADDLSSGERNGKRFPIDTFIHLKVYCESQQTVGLG